MTTNWTGVRARVTALRPHRGRAFGSGRHGFALADPLTESQLRDAERYLGVTLPAEYRTFLAEVGAGGAGPDYGLFPLAATPDGWGWPGQYDDEPADLAAEFLSVTERERLDAEHSAREPREADFADPEAHLAAFRAWDDEWETLRRRMTAGSVQIGEQGCGYSSWLVVSGPHRGSVWEDGFAADALMSQLAPDFRTWYLDWLARAEVESRGRR
ncbi:SMI1/KNR4 family protein [Kitasatospora sp. NA04385]|uniref:SMI1/KNR4 family protein n=1 Tax=Kitasatospora sp. NA04385 TaxID=2742135 RepID=UPI001591324E|nr:SMI1/KNR4 family protein [Kitasatospora sp. NA04385]QKW20918.1 SMI1/KNR4 family protein [Kitasatospora sp. NA04385]